MPNCPHCPPLTEQGAHVKRLESAVYAAWLTLQAAQCGGSVVLNRRETRALMETLENALDGGRNGH